MTFARYTLMILLLIGACTTELFAQRKSDIMEHHWVGMSKLDADFTDQPIYLKQEMDLDIDTEFNMTGTLKTTFTIDGRPYVLICALSGKFSTYSNKLRYKSGKHYREDRLPQGLQWCNGWGELELVRDPEDEGYYALQGYEDDDCGGRSYLVFSDRKQ